MTGIKQVLSERIGSRVTTSGWVEDVRPLGKLLFVTIRDVSSSIQCVIAAGTVPFSVASSVPRQSYVVVSGLLKESRSKNYPVEISVERFEVLGEAKHPLPLDPTGRVEASLDVRLDARALDLRNPKVSSIFKIKSSFLKVARDFLTGEGFIEVNTAKIIGAAAEGGAELFKLKYFERDAYLAQSPQLYKEELTLSLQKVYEIATYFRAEKSHTTRHLNEFLSLDIEAALHNKEDVMCILERLVSFSIMELSKSEREGFEKLGFNPVYQQPPFPRITYSDALQKLSSMGRKIEFGDDLDSEALKLLASTQKSYYYFITDWPSSAKPFYIKPSDDDIRLSESFDLMAGPLELASGGERVSKRSQLESRLKEKGLRVEEFEYHLRAYDWGMPPHSGWGFGVDRFIAQLTKQANIREAVLYPRDDTRLTP